MSKNNVISMSIGGKWDTAPYHIGDFPHFNNNTYPMVPWTNPWDEFKPYVPPKSPEIMWTFTGLPTKEVKMNEQPKLDRIKGLIEGFLLAVEGTDREESVGSDALLNKILKVIEE